MRQWTNSTEYAQRQWEKMTAKPFGYHPTLKPAASESRICFGIAYFNDLAEADTYAAYVREKGHAYNGGWMDGKPCGREPEHDFVGPDGKPYHAVSH